MTEHALRLNDEQVARFYREGFLALDQIAPRDEVRLITELVDGLMARIDELPQDMIADLGDVRHHDGKKRIPQINLPSKFEPRLKATACYRNAESIARQLIGSDAVLRWEHTIYKLPHNGKETPWHQDLAYPVQSANNPKLVQFGCNIWIPLQDTSVAMGCMQFLPFSHLGNLRAHHPVGNDPKVHTLQTDDVDPKHAVACPLPAGGATLHQPKTMHYTGPNTTDTPRRAWILNFGYPVTSVG